MVRTMQVARGFLTKCLSLPYLLRLFWILRFTVAGIALFLPLSHPHIWRQIDTLGVSLRYWLRWATEAPAAWPLVPAILHSGDVSGLMPMELPLLNLLAAPLFSFGPEFGTVLARGLSLGLNLGLLFWNRQLWQHLKPLKIDAAASWLLMPLFGLGLIYFPRFIPDVLAMLLVLAAVAYLLQGRAALRAILLLSLGLLIKPTAVIVLALLWLDPKPLQRSWRALPVYAVGVAWTAVYYLGVNAWIKQLGGGGDSLYRLEPQAPLQALREFFSTPAALWNLFLQGLGFWGAVPLLLLLSLHHSVRPLRRLWLIFVAQILCIATLDGAHAFLHQYYFIGVMPTLCLVLKAVIDDLPGPGTWLSLRSLLLTLGLGSVLSAMAYELRPLRVPTGAERFLDFKQCAKLRQQLPDWPWQSGHVFRTFSRPYPLVGLCIGERVDSTQSVYGIFLRNDPRPAACKVVASTEQLLATRCD